MRFFLRSLAVACVLTSALGVARADTFSGTASFTDTSSPSNNNYNFTGTFDDPSFSFSATSPYTYTDNLELTINNASCNFFSCGHSATDAVSATIDFSQPSNGSGQFSGNGGALDIFGYVIDGGIVWSGGNTQTITFNDGSTATIDLHDTGTILSNQLTDDMTITVDPASPSATPEPSSLALLGTGILGLAGLARRKFAL